jgi:hypothetical protein
VIVAMHRIPGKYGSPRPTVIKFLGIDTTITFLYKKKKLNDASEVKIGDDITKQNQGFINTKCRHTCTPSAWYFSEHVFWNRRERHKTDL